MDKNNNTTTKNSPTKEVSTVVNTTPTSAKKQKAPTAGKATHKFKLYLLGFIVLLILGIYGYFKYNQQITNLSYLLPTMHTDKEAAPPQSMPLDEKSPPIPVASDPIAGANLTPAQEGKAYQDFILQLTNKLTQINQELALLKQQRQEQYSKIINKFNLIYALDHGEVPLSLLESVATNANPKLKQQLNQLTKFSNTGIQTNAMINESFNTTVYQDIYLQSLKANKSPWGFVQYYFAKLVFIQNFDNTTITNKNDMRIKLNDIKIQLANHNYADAYDTVQTIDSTMLSANTLTWKQQLYGRLKAEQLITILKTS